MIQNATSSTTDYGGSLTWNPTISFAFTVNIPLYIKTYSVPIRVPKITEINTIPSFDEVGMSDWSTHSIFYGGAELLTTSMQGFFLTPTTPVQDGLTKLRYNRLNPTHDGTNFGAGLGLLDYSYSDVVWLYLNGKLNNVNNIFKRTDPTSFTDPYGNVYNNPLIAEFDSEYTVTTTKQNFNMKLLLEI